MMMMMMIMIIIIIIIIMRLIPHVDVRYDATSCDKNAAKSKPAFCVL